SGLRRLCIIAAPAALLTSQMGATAFANSDPPFAAAVGWQASRQAEPLQKWRDILRRVDSESRRVKSCIKHYPCMDLAARPLAALVLELKGQSKARMVRAVNDHFNSFPYVPDQSSGMAVDRWLTPILFDQVSGDCEDYAIAKYFVLRLLGLRDRQ